ncbi:hypothetical protein GCM10023211_08850 [Orbus sasakiae]|uniref:Uncharacterized protein n=1 Tax=Orbus sasakiae TaxID=1078475 RepID=A0ABP9N2I7_9GAMM
MIILVIYLAFCIFVGMIAKAAGRSFITWTALSFIIDPILAVIVFFIVAKNR